MIQPPRDVRRVILTLLAAACLLPVQAKAQSGPGWFVPEQAKPPAPGPAPTRPAAAPARPRPASSEVTAPPAVPLTTPRDGMGGGPETLVPLGDPQAGMPPLQVMLPPPPEIPPIPKGPPTPAAIVGILSPPDILRVSSAYQQAEKVIRARQQKLAEDDQKQQITLRDLGLAFSNERGKLTPEQIRTREKEYAERMNDWRRVSTERSRILQEASQYVMAQIYRAVEQISQQVAASRGVNLVLIRGQILGTTSDFDLTPQVADILNKVLPTVVIPPDGVSPTKLGSVAAGPRANAAIGGNGGSEATPGKKN